jgi:hypothetical protein
MKALLVDALNLNGASFPERGQTVTVSFSRDDLIVLDHQSRLNSHSPTILSACRDRTGSTSTPAVSFLHASRPVSANSGHCPRARRMGQTDPERALKISPMNGR